MHDSSHLYIFDCTFATCCFSCSPQGKLVDEGDKRGEEVVNDGPWDEVNANPKFCGFLLGLFEIPSSMETKYI